MIDFSVPYFYSGVSCLSYTRITNDSIPLLGFLVPFSPHLWICIFVSLVITAFAAAMYEWLSPFGLNPWGRQRTKNFTLASALWVMTSLLFSHLVAFKAPKSWPNKVWSPVHISSFSQAVSEKERQGVNSQNHFQAKDTAAQNSTKWTERHFNIAYIASLLFASSTVVVKYVLHFLIWPNFTCRFTFVTTEHGVECILFFGPGPKVTLSLTSSLLSPSLFILHVCKSKSIGFFLVTRDQRLLSPSKLFPCEQLDEPLI